ncbi:hypothetical protein EMCRGX_G021252 [Ephydatia muelleri]
MHDSVRIERNGLDCVVFGVGNESTKHIQKMISRQKSSSASRGRLKDSTQAAPATPERFKAQIRELLTSYPDGLRCDRFSEAYAKRFGCYANYRCWGFASLDHMLRSIPDVVTCQRENSKNAVVIRLNKRPMLASVSRQSSSAQANQGMSLNSLELMPDDIRTNKNQAPPSVPENIESRVEQLLADKCSGIWASKFAGEYKVHFGHDLPYKENIVGFLSSLKACELQSDPNTSDWLVLSSERKHSKVEEQGVPEELSFAINSTVANHPKGIPLDKFKQVFKEEHGRELLFLPHGFFSVAEMLVHVPGVRVEKPSTCPEVMVLPAQGCVARGTEAMERHTKDKPKVDHARVPKVVLEHSPTGYVVQPHPSEKTCPVYVSYVKSPSCLYVQIIGETTTKALESLSEEMYQFYSGKEGRKSTIECVQIGQACCTVYPEDCYWYRAEVLDVPSPDVVKVKYVDYGNIGQVPRVTLRRPKAHYMLLPAQALKCRLSNIKPASEKWCERASLLLGTMTKDRPLVATITSVTDNILSLYLCDTNTDKDIHISDRLVDQGLAIVAMDTVEDEARFDGINLEPPPSTSSEDVANIRPPSSCPMPPSSCPMPPSSLPSAEVLAYFQALWQLTQTPSPLDTPVAMSTNTESILVPPWHSVSSSPRGSLPVANGGSSVGSNLKDLNDTLKSSSEDLSRDSNDSGDCLKDLSGGGGGVDSSCRHSSVTQCRSSANESGEANTLPVGVTRTHQFVRRVQLTPTHTLHVLNHGQKALVLSSEVSGWFWHTDQLRSRLQQSSKQIWAQVLSRNRAQQLFTELASHTKLIKSSETSLIAYSLEDLPAIVQTFSGPDELGVSVRREVTLWQSSPAAYFSCVGGSEEVGTGEEEMNLLENKLQDLHIQRSVHTHPTKPVGQVHTHPTKPVGQVHTQPAKPVRKIQIKPVGQVTPSQPNQSIKSTPTQPNQLEKSTPSQSNQLDKSTPSQPNQSIKSTPAQQNKSTPTQPNQLDKSTPIPHQSSCDPVASLVVSKGRPRLAGLGRGTPYIKPTLIRHKM